MLAACPLTWCVLRLGALYRVDDRGPRTDRVAKWVTAADTDTIARQRREAAHVALQETLPGLLMKTTADARTLSGHDQERLFGLLAVQLLAVQLFAAHSVTHKTGYEDLSAVVEDRITWAADRSGDHLAEATSISRHLGDQDSDGGYYQLSSGPTNVAIHQVAASVELSDGTLASLHTARNLAPQATRQHAKSGASVTARPSTQQRIPGPVRRLGRRTPVTPPAAPSEGTPRTAPPGRPDQAN